MAKFEPKESKVFITATDAAEMLGVSRQHLNKMIQAGRFPKTERVGSFLLLRINEVQDVKDKRAAGELTDEPVE